MKVSGAVKGDREGVAGNRKWEMGHGKEGEGKDRAKR